MTSEIQTLRQALHEHQNGRVEAAAEQYRQVIARQPENSDALHLFGLLNHEQGKSEEAIRLISKAVQLQTESGVLHNSLGVAQLSAGLLKLAAQSFRDAIKQEPRLAEAHRNLGVVALQLGLLEESQASLETSLQLDPDIAQTHIDLGHTTMKRQDWWTAEASYRKAIAIASTPELKVTASVSLAKLLNSQRRFAEASQAVEPIVSGFPNHAFARLQLGIALGRQGHHKLAAEQLRAAIELEPDSVPVCYNLSVSLLSLNKAEESLSLAKRVATQQPSPQHQRHLAAVFKRLGSLDQSIELLIGLCEQSPEDFGLREEIAEIEFDRGNTEEAICIYRDLLEIDPTRRQTLLRLAKLCEQAQRVDQTVETCVRILQKHPDSVGAHLLLGIVLSSRLAPKHRAKLDLAEQDDLRKRAMKHLQRATILDPSPETFDAWGRALMNVGRHEEAISRFQHAISLMPDFAASHENLGKAWLELGKLDLAKESYRTAISIYPRLCDAQYELARLDGKDQSPDQIDQLKQLLLDAESPRPVRMMLHFALARRLDAVSESGQAFQHYALGNSLKEPMERRRLVDETRVTDDLIRVFGASYFSEHASGGSDSALPVFIVGMPRSGTTLVEQIVSSHPDVLGAGELSDIADLANSLSRRLASRMQYPDVASQLSANLAAELSKEYVARLQRIIARMDDTSRHQSTLRVTDKMPTNFRHLGLIGSLFPNATIIHVQRDPRDVCISCFKQNLAWPFCDLEAVALYYRQYRRLMDHWREVIPNAIHDIQYETLVENQDEQSQRLIEAIGLPWSEDCLNFADSPRAVQTPSKWQVRQPIYRSSVGGWKKYETHLGDLFKVLSLDEQ